MALSEERDKIGNDDDVCGRRGTGQEEDLEQRGDGLNCLERKLCEMRGVKRTYIY